MSVYEYPGAGAPLNRYANDRGKPQYPRGIDHRCTGAHSDLLMVREVAMMMLMEKITDKPDWQEKVFDEAITAKYRREALDWPADDLYREIWLDRGVDLPPKLNSIFNDRTVDFCLQELQEKARYFKETGIIPTLDATYGMAKSDVVVDTSLHEKLLAALDRLRTDQGDSPDWHPNTSDKVQNLVHPSMYPLVYGHSRFIQEEVVGVDDAIEKWAGKGDVLPKPSPPESRYPSEHHSNKMWSQNYQWLPSNIRFKEGGGVAFTSYINNLHPTKHRDIYHTIEKLIEKALPLWDQCLPQIEDGDRVAPGRTYPRLPIPSDPSDDDACNWEIGESEPCEEEPQLEGIRQDRKPVLRDPRDDPLTSSDYNSPDEFGLREMFKHSGLQIIVKMASIELDPSKPQFPAGNWHVEGQMNEHIVGTALYYLESENVTPSRLSFRMMTRDSQYDEGFDHVNQDAYKWLEMVYGTKLGSGSYGICLQNYGSMETKQGRLVAFPNVFQHRVSPFELLDATKPGRRSFIALWLVDPFTRIISTANVPPQREDWFSERAFRNIASGVGVDNEKTAMRQEVARILLERDIGKGELENAVEGLPNAHLPPELLEMLRKELGEDLLMTEEKAKEHRLKLMEERSVLQMQANEEIERYTYSFCEH